MSLACPVAWFVLLVGGRAAHARLRLVGGFHHALPQRGLLQLQRIVLIWQRRLQPCTQYNCA